MYYDSITNQLDVAHYEPNKLLVWRYQLANLYSTPKNAIVNHCQTYQTPDFFLYRGKNEELPAKTLEIKFNNDNVISMIYLKVLILSMFIHGKTKFQKQFIVLFMMKKVKIFLSIFLNPIFNND